MASGIDMSARLITLAVNIALMGVILVDGVFSYLKGVGVGSRRVAEEIAAGHVVGGSVPGDVARAALVHGFERVLLYGGVGVIVLATISWWVMNGVGADERRVPEPLAKGTIEEERDEAVPTKIY
jgi:hypothetical protein